MWYLELRSKLCSNYGSQQLIYTWHLLDLLVWWKSLLSQKDKLSMQRNYMLHPQSAVKLTSNMAASQITLKKIPTNTVQDRKFITHFNSKLAVADRTFSVPLPLYYTSVQTTIDLHLSPFQFSIVVLVCMFRVAQCVFSIYEMTESDLSVAGRSVWKMPLDCEM